MTSDNRANGSAPLLLVKDLTEEMDLFPNTRLAFPADAGCLFEKNFGIALSVFFD
jgi:hypothetical protein